MLQINIEEEIIAKMTELISVLEANIKDHRVCHNAVELVKVCIQKKNFYSLIFMH